MPCWSNCARNRGSWITYKVATSYKVRIVCIQNICDYTRIQYFFKSTTYCTIHNVQSNPLYYAPGPLTSIVASSMKKTKTKKWDKSRTKFQEKKTKGEEGGGSLMCKKLDKRYYRKPVPPKKNQHHAKKQHKKHIRVPRPRIAPTRTPRFAHCRMLNNNKKENQKLIKWEPRKMQIIKTKKNYTPINVAFAPVPSAGATPLRPSLSVAATPWWARSPRAGNTVSDRVDYAWVLSKITRARRQTTKFDEWKRQ